MMKKTTIILLIAGILFNLTPFMTGTDAGRDPASVQTEGSLLWDYGNPALILH